MAIVERWLEDATQLAQEGRLAPAEALLRRLLKKHPKHQEAAYNLGTLLFLQGRPEDAIPWLERAAGQDTGFVEAAGNLGVALMSLRRWEEAERHLRHVLRLRPMSPEALTNLAIVLRHRQKYGEAAGALQQSLALRPDHPETLLHLGLTFEKMKRYDEAMARLEEVLPVLPESSDTWYECLSSLVVCFERRRHFDRAIACCHQILAARPDDPGILFDLGVCLLAVGDAVGAIACQERALAQVPDNAHLLYNSSEAYLRSGRFGVGWERYEYRLRVRPEHIVRFAQVPYPLWSGEAPAGRRIFVSQEQGYGDTFQFIRLLPQLQALGAEVHFQCQPGLSALFARCAGFDEISEQAPNRDVVLPSDPCDCWIPLMSLLRLFGTRLETIPADVPYIFPDPENVRAWEERLSSRLPAGVPRVGLVWAGSHTMADDHIRSANWADLAPLAGAGPVAWVSLQKGPAAAQRGTMTNGLSVLDLNEELTRWDDTAAVIQNLDGVIVVDTAIAHLTGALGKPVWLALPYGAEWRWLMGRDDSPWYPTMRMFRQSEPWDWRPVYTKIAETLRATLPGVPQNPL